jgi:ribosomal protein L24E
MLTKKTMACQEAKEAHLEKMKANPEEIKYITEHQEVTKEEAAVETNGALDD